MLVLILEPRGRELPSPCYRGVAWGGHLAVLQFTPQVIQQKPQETVMAVAVMQGITNTPTMHGFGSAQKNMCGLRLCG